MRRAMHASEMRAADAAAGTRKAVREIYRIGDPDLALEWVEPEFETRSVFVPVRALCVNSFVPTPTTRCGGGRRCGGPAA